MSFNEEQQEILDRVKARLDAQGGAEGPSFTPEQLDILNKVKARVSNSDGQGKVGSAGSGLDESGRLGVMPFLNKSLANTLAAPVDSMGALMDGVSAEVRAQQRWIGDKLLGWDTSFFIPDEEDVPKYSGTGSQMVRGIFAKLGAPTPERGPKHTTEYIGSGLGEAFGFATGGLSLAKRASALKNAADPRIIDYIKGFADDVYKTAVKNPGKVLAAELGAGAGVGVGREIADKNDLGPAASLLTELGAGIVGGGLMSIPTATGLALKGTKKGAEKAAFTLSEKGAFERASARMKEIAENSELAAQNVEDLKGSFLRPADRTNDPALVALERAILAQDPAESTRVSKHYSKAIQDLIAQIKKSGESKSAREFLEATRERLFKAQDARIAKASDEIVKALESSGDELSSVDFQNVARERLESALADAKVQEKLLWEAVPQDVKIPISSFQKKFIEIWKNVPRAQRKHIPEDAKKFFDFLSDKNVRAIRFSEMEGLYKELGQIARNARAGDQPNPFMASMATSLRESILKDMGNPLGDVKAKEAVQLARAFSFQINEKFKRGSIGKILQFERAGGIKTPGERTLEVGVGQPRTQGMLAAREFRDAVTSIPQGGKGAATDVKAMQSVQGYIKQKFMESAFDSDGTLNRSKADTFLLRNKETLEMFPTLKNQLESARGLEDVRREVKNSVDAFKKKYDNPNVSFASKYLKAPVDREIETIMNSKNPSPDQIMTELLKETRAIKGEDRKKVLEGFKSAMTEWLIDKHMSTTRVDVSGNLKVGGLAMKATLKQPEIKKAFNMVYGPEAFKRLRGLVDEIAKIDRQMSFSDKQPTIINDPVAKFIEIPVRYIATKVVNWTAGIMPGSGSAGTDIQLAQMTSNETKRLLQKMNIGKAKQILIDAQNDEELYKALLLNQKTAPIEEVKKANRKINAWLLGPGSRLLDEEDE